MLDFIISALQQTINAICTSFGSKSYEINQYSTFYGSIQYIQNPYCIFIYEGKEYRTSTHAAGGVKPKWNHTINFNIKTIDILKIEVWSRSVIGNDSLVGRADVDLKKLMLEPGKTNQCKFRVIIEQIQLFYERISSGKLIISITFAAPASKNMLSNDIELINFNQRQRNFSPALRKGIFSNSTQLLQLRKIQNQNKLLPKQQITTFPFPKYQTNGLCSSQIKSIEKNIFKGVTKMNFNRQYYDQNPMVVSTAFQKLNLGLPHHRPTRQRSISFQHNTKIKTKNPSNNGIAVTQSLRDSLTLANSKQSLIQQKSTIQNQYDISLRNSFSYGFRQNRINSTDNKILQFNSQKQIKPILSKGKNRQKSKSKKKVSFKV